MFEVNTYVEYLTLHHRHIPPNYYLHLLCENSWDMVSNSLHLTCMYSWDTLKSGERTLNFCKMYLHTSKFYYQIYYPPTINHYYLMSKWLASTHWWPSTPFPRFLTSSPATSLLQNVTFFTIKITVLFKFTAAVQHHSVFWWFKLWASDLWKTEITY